MPKRKDKSSDEYLRRKIRKIEKKLKRRSRKISSSSSSDNPNTELSLREDNQPEVFEDVPVSSHSIDDSPSLPNVELEQHILESSSDIPSTSVVSNETTIALDKNILDLLGETPSTKKMYSSPIQSELAVRWEHIATTGLPKDIKKDLLEKYFLPENCLKIGSPQLNPEIKAALSDVLVKKDEAIEVKQNQQAMAITCVGQALTKMFAEENKNTCVIKLLLDAVRLLCDYQYVESMSRRSFVTSSIKKEIKDHLYLTEIDSFLFGEKLADTLRSAKAITKSGAVMKTLPPQKPTSFPQHRPNQSRPLNVRPPLPLARQTGAGRRPAPTTQQPRRYQAIPPPPPPPPPQPQRSRGRRQMRR